MSDMESRQDRINRMVIEALDHILDQWNNKKCRDMRLISTLALLDISNNLDKIRTELEMMDLP